MKQNVYLIKSQENVELCIKCLINFLKFVFLLGSTSCLIGILPSTQKFCLKNKNITKKYLPKIMLTYLINVKIQNM